jgi:hypothetical protein
MIISLSKGLNKITFDRFFNANDGSFAGILIRHCDNPVANTVLNGIPRRELRLIGFIKC